MVNARFSPGNRDQARKTFGLNQEKVILTVARLDARNGYKGHDKIIRMLPSLLEQHNNRLVYLIAGVGEDQSRLETLASELGVSEATRFLGHVPARDLPDLYRAADVFAMPSTGEGFGIVYLEAMACGTRAIGLNVGGVRDVFENNDYGWCVEEADFPATLRQALLDPTPAPDMISRYTHNRFGQTAFRARLAHILEQVVPSHD
jgi:phosphatidylinositol alpha-1,6-mannosyltransferase